MSATLTPRPTFRETVVLVAAKAKATLPQAVNGRVEAAVKLVLATMLRCTRMARPRWAAAVTRLTLQRQL